MNTLPFPRSGVNDALLFDIAKRIQLSPTNYRLATERYQTLDSYLRRPESSLREHIVRLYPQGSMAIGAVISSKFDHDEFDVDIVVELAIAHHTAPGVVLDALHDAIRGERGSRYFGKTARRSRCITVEYDDMHIDFTPAARLIDPRERVSHIFHANEAEPSSAHFRVTANPFGFAQWFESRMPAAQYFAESVLRKHAEPLPDQDELDAKALPLLALQLLKRWRNKRYDDRRGIRKPPSVVLSYHVGLMASSNRGLLEELTAQTDALLLAFEESNRKRSLIEVRNPSCQEDVLTDRWPESAVHQALFLDDLRDLRSQLAELGTALIFGAI